MKKNNSITIGLTCFNAQETILRALESAINQTWLNKEVVVVDDASTDKSVQILKTKLEQGVNFRLIQHSSNQGVGGARQTILDNSSGEFVTFFDDDDYSFPDRLEEQHKKILRYEKTSGSTLVACFVSGKRLYPNNYEIKLNAIGSKVKIPFGTDVADRLLFFGGDREMFFGTGTPACSLMARKSTFESVGGFDKNFCRVEDIDFAIRLALAGGHFIGTKKEFFVQYATGSQDKTPEANLDAELQLVSKFQKYLESKNRYFYAKKWPLLRYYHFTGQYHLMFFLLLQLIIRHPIKTTLHFCQTAPKRFLHEKKIKRKL